MATHRRFIGSLVRQEYRDASPSELNDLLHWLAGRTNNAAAAIQAAFEAHGVSRETARRRTLAYLDHSMFRYHGDQYRLLGLTPDCSFSAIRSRHKQLLQTFHPDRHAYDQEWFTARTEELNRAYAHLRKNHGQTRDQGAGPPGVAPPPRRTRQAAAPRGAETKPWKTMAVQKVRLRRKLKSVIGSPARFERRLYFVLFSVPAILFLVIYLDHLQISGGSPPDRTGNPRDAQTQVKHRGGDGVADTPVPANGHESVAPRAPSSLARQNDAAGRSCSLSLLAICGPESRRLSEKLVSGTTPYFPVMPPDVPQTTVGGSPTDGRPEMTRWFADIGAGMESARDPTKAPRAGSSKAISTSEKSRPRTAVP